MGRCLSRGRRGVGSVRVPALRLVHAVPGAGGGALPRRRRAQPSPAGRCFTIRRCGYCAKVIEVRHELAAPVVFVELQRGSTLDLARVLRTAIAAGDVRLVVDLGETREATSDDLSLLHRAGQYLRRIGGSLAIVAPPPSIRRLLDMTLLSQAIPVFASRDEALRDLR